MNEGDGMNMKKIKLYLHKISDYMDVYKLRGEFSFLRILIDVAICNIRYGATISNYFSLRFYEKTHYSRKKFITESVRDNFYKCLNDKNARRQIHNKYSFNKNFEEYIKRDYVLTPDCGKEKFVEFLQGNENVFVKPLNKGGGDGIIKISSKECEQPDKVYDFICTKGKCVVETEIIQHPQMALLHPNSVNTIRIATVFDGKEVKILFAGLRCGVGGSFIDNHMSGGICMQVDVQTGKVCSLACGDGVKNIVKHPDTKVFLPGFQVPLWDKCLEIVDSAARKTEGVGFVGWDIAVLEDDVCLIEANPSAAFGILQEPNQEGGKELLTQILDEYKGKNFNK